MSTGIAYPPDAFRLRGARSILAALFGLGLAVASFASAAQAEDQWRRDEAAPAHRQAHLSRPTPFVANNRVRADTPAYSGNRFHTPGHDRFAGRVVNGGRGYYDPRGYYRGPGVALGMSLYDPYADPYSPYAEYSEPDYQYPPPPPPAEDAPAPPPVASAPMAEAPDGDSFIGPNGQTCRTFRSTATIDNTPQEVQGTTCLQPDGTWRMVN